MKNRPAKKRPVPWNRAFHLLTELADEDLTATEYATTVRRLHDLLVEKHSDADAVRDFLLLYHTSELHHQGRISKRHRELVLKQLPKPPPRKRGRPKGAVGDKAYEKRYKLYHDWIHESTLDPSLTKEQFARNRLRITDADLEGLYESDYRAKIDALLQELKPARMKQLDEGQRRSLEVLYPNVITRDREFARQWREAKQRTPTLTKEDFIQNYMGWPRSRKRHPVEEEALREFLESLDRGEKQLADFEPAAQSTTKKRKNTRSR